ncbi:hypothetical protein BC827DRAFT_781443 [Russula dissimulans]|nr:hypothetical protein BC827DRAFT_781443 [Russula dissimulans]
MSHLRLAPSTSQIQSAQFVNDYINHPDYRLVAAFFLGWVFLSSLRHIWFSAFLQELMWTLYEIANRLRGRAVTSERFPQEKPGDAHRSSLEQRDGLVLILCLGFMLASLASFLSLLTFYPYGTRGACTFVIAATSIASQAARVFGLLILIHNLKNRSVGPWELRILLALLGLGTILSGITIGIGSGQLVAPMMVPNVALCFRRRFLPTSLASSGVNFTLELYIIIRSLSLMRPPRLRLRIVRDAGVIQAGSLLFFDLLIVVPNTIFTSLLAEFILYSIGALGVLAAFNSSFGQTNLGPTQPAGPNLNSNTRGPRNAVRAPEALSLQGNISNRVSNNDNAPFSGPNWDIEAQFSSLRDPREIRRAHIPPLDRFYGEASSAQPVQASAPTIAYDSITLAAQLQHPKRLRREKILSYSSPIWATFGAPRRDEDTEESTRPEMTIEVAGSSTSSIISHTGHSRERDTKVLRSSSILGSDIIRATSSNERKNRMRVRGSAIGPTLSLTASIPSSSRRVTHQSLQSRLSAYPSADDDISPVSLIPKSAEQSTRRTSSLGKRSKSSRSSKSHKSSSSMRSVKAAATTPAEEGPPEPPTPWIGTWTGRARVSRTFSATSRGNRASFVRGPRPPPSPMRMRNSRLSGA